MIATSPANAGDPVPSRIRALVMTRSYGGIVGGFGFGVAPVRAAMTRSSSAKYWASETLG